MRKFIIVISMIFIVLTASAQEIQFERTYDYLDFWDDNVKEWGWKPNTDVSILVVYNYRDNPLYTKIVDVSSDEPLFNMLIRPITELQSKENDIQYYSGEDATGKEVLVALLDDKGILMLSFGKNGIRFIDTKRFEPDKDEKPFNMY